MSTTEFKNAISRRVAPPKLLVGEDATTSTSGRAVSVTSDGALATAVVTTSGAESLAGVEARIPLAATYTYDTGLTMTFDPYINGLSVGLSDTGAESVTYAPSAGGGFITVTVDGGTSTVATLGVTWAASDAAAVCGFSGDAGTIPALASYGPQELFDDYAVATGADFKATETGLVVPTLADPDGRTQVRPYLTAIGAATAAVSATPEVGVTGRLPTDVTFTIDTGMTATVHPLQGGVSVAITNGGAAAVSATGKAVTLTAKNDDSTTINAMNALIAADAAVAALIAPLVGTGTDTFDAAVSIAATDLWDEGTIPSGAQFALDEDGYWSPMAQGSNSVVMVPIGAATPATADEQVGVTGRLPQDYTYTISAGNDITIHPLVGGVSVIVTTAGAAAVSATGKVVTLTNKNDDSTTVAAMQALIAASASVAALLTIDGTAGDTFDHLLTLTETALWTTGTIPAQAMVTLGSDGYYWPAETDSTGGIKVSQTSLIAGEDLTAGRLKTMNKAALGSGGILVASGTGHNAACVVHRLMIAETGGANPITVLLRDGGAGGTIKTPTITVAASGSTSLELNTSFGTDCYVTCGGAGTPSVCVNVHSG